MGVAVTIIDAGLTSQASRDDSRC